MIFGTVFNISRYAIHDGPGIRTTVFLKGCPLSCWWCHNPESISPHPEISLRLNRCIRCGTCVDQCPNHALSITDDEVTTDPASCQLCFECAKVCPSDAREVVGRSMTVAEVMTEIKKDVPFYDESGGGVTFSGGEPLMQPAFLLELLDACGRLDIHRAVDTSGHAGRDTLLEVAERTDLFLYDLKHMDPVIHRKFTGVSNELILENLKALSCRPVAIRIRFPLIPGVNDDPLNVERTACFLQKLHRVCYIDILPYHDVASSKYKRFGYNYKLRGLPPSDAAHLQDIAATLSSYGLCVTIGGNEYERTYPQAQAMQP
ncbi:MAG: glycyl-radical enzyme activating protein [Acidobacteriia bacterium]|nr:glycyl-radical enzyme activating protein [Terriglobia bacterium]